MEYETNAERFETIAKSVIIICVLYFGVFICFGYLWLLITGVPMDLRKSTAGVILGVLVSTIPQFIVGYYLGKLTSSDYHKTAVKIAMWYNLLEKFFPITLAILMFSDHYTLVLSEEFPFYIFGMGYVIPSVVLSFVSLFVGLELRKKKTKGIW